MQGECSNQEHEHYYAVRPLPANHFKKPPQQQAINHEIHTQRNNDVAH